MKDTRDKVEVEVKVEVEEKTDTKYLIGVGPRQQTAMIGIALKSGRFLPLFATFSG